MKSDHMQKIVVLLGLGVALLLFSGVSSFAAVDFDAPAIEAEIAAAVAAGEEPALAAKNVIANAVLDLVEANPDYPGGTEALHLAILDALAGLNITGLDTADLLAAGNHALGLKLDTELEAYENSSNLRERGRENAREHGGKAYGPGGKPKPGSPT